MATLPSVALTAATVARAPLARRGALGDEVAGDLEGGFERLVLSFQDDLYRFAVGMTGDAGAGQEVVQDTFVSAYRALRTYDADRVRALAFRPWLHRITLNLCRNRARGRRPNLVFLEHMPEPVDTSAGPEALALRHDQQGRLLDALAQLPFPLRAATVLKYGRDLSYREIADLLDEPVGTVKARVPGGVARLRAHLDHDGQGVIG